MDTYNINENDNSDTKHGVLKDVEFVEVKTEILSEDYLQNEDVKTLSKSTVEKHFINDFINFKVKKENIEDEVEENGILETTFGQSCSTRIKDEYKEAKFSYEEYNTSEIKEEDTFVGIFIAKPSKEINDYGDVDDKIDIKEMHFVPNEFDKNKYTLETANSDDQREAVTKRKSPDQPKDEKQSSTKRRNPIHNKKSKMKNCQFCNKSFTSKHSLDDHLLKQHKNKISSDIKHFITYKIHTCTICSYETTRKCLLDMHISKHIKQDRNRNCKFCDKSYNSKRSLDDHILQQHKQEIKGDLESFITTKIHTCNICNSYKTTNKINIDRHVNAVHNEVKLKMKCQFCTEAFISKQSLDGHVLRKHKDKIQNNIKSLITSKIHKCTICNSYETTNKSHLDQHINSIHNEEKLKLKCQFCSESFVLQTSLDGHVLRKHKDEINGDIRSFITSKIYSCDSCSFESTVKNVVKIHVNSIHNKKFNSNIK